MTEGPKLEASESWFAATPEEREAQCNGCGPEGWKALQKAIPEAVLGVSIRAACCIHDWDYVLHP